MFDLITNLYPKGDQPEAIKKLVESIWKGKKEQVLLGATGTGKTFTMANIIQQTQKPTLILVHNKTLAMQIYQEMQGFFPHNRVEYYVSYFDYYRPEYYNSDNNKYGNKEARRNSNIAKMRLKTLNTLITKNDIIVVASVAAIYGCYNPTAYRKALFNLKVGQKMSRRKLIKKLNFLGYRLEKKVKGGGYGIRENEVIFMLMWEESNFFSVNITNSKVQKIELINQQIGEKKKELEKIAIPPGRNYLGEESEELAEILQKIEAELADRKEYFYQTGEVKKAERLEEKTQKNLLDLREKSFCPGIENYARYFDGREADEPPFTLLDYFANGFLTIIDESHITIPQLKAMYSTNRRRLETLIEYGFRLPSAFDNRPLNLTEFFQKIDYVLYVSATPGDFELAKVNYQTVEQIIRPTGLLDPELEIRPRKRNNRNSEIIDIMQEIEMRKIKEEKVLIYALTIAMSEDIARYLQERDIKVVYLHSRLDIFERYQAITSLRRGVYDVIVGINLLKEGIDLPEVSLVCILDADTPGFLRDTRSLIQIIGRASRNRNGKVILYADEITNNMRSAIEETNRRRQIQQKYNQQNSIIPRTVEKPVKDIILDPLIVLQVEKAQRGEIKEKELRKLVKNLRKQMKKSTKEFKFDQAIAFRNALLDLEKLERL